MKDEIRFEWVPAKDMLADTLTKCGASLNPIIRKNMKNKPSRGVSRLQTVFLAKKLSKYRLKQPHYVVLGDP